MLALGAIALAGDGGLTVEETADFVGVSRGELQGFLRRLTPGGLIHSDCRRPSDVKRAGEYRIRRHGSPLGAVAETEELGQAASGQ